MRISDWSSDGCSSDLHLIRASQVSLLLFEQQVLKKDFFAQLLELEPAIVDALPGKLVSQHYPFLRHLVALCGARGTAEPLERKRAWEGKGGADVVVFVGVRIFIKKKIIITNK